MVVGCLNIGTTEVNDQSLPSTIPLGKNIERRGGIKSKVFCSHDDDDDSCTNSCSESSFSTADGGDWSSSHPWLLASLKRRRHHDETNEENDYNNVIKVGCSYSYHPNLQQALTSNSIGSNTNYVDDRNGRPINDTSNDTSADDKERCCSPTPSPSKHIYQDCVNANTSACEVSRLTVNTHTSILNITEEDDDDDDEYETSSNSAALITEGAQRLNFRDERNFLFGSEMNPDDTPDCRLSPCPSSDDNNHYHPLLPASHNISILDSDDIETTMDASGTSNRSNTLVLTKDSEWSRGGDGLHPANISNPSQQPPQSFPVQPTPSYSSPPRRSRVIGVVVPDTPPALSSTVCFDLDATSTPHQLCPASSAGSDLSFVDQVMDNFVEGFFCVSKTKSAKNGKPDQTVTASADDLWEGYRRLLEYDILILLGCIDSPEQDEIEHLWAWPRYYQPPVNGGSDNTKNSSSSIFFCLNGGAGRLSGLCPTVDARNGPYYRRHPSSSLSPGPMGSGPHRLSWKQRCAKVHRIRQERNLPAVESGLVLLAPTQVPYSPLSPTSKQSAFLLPRTSRSFEESFFTQHYRPSKNLSSALEPTHEDGVDDDDVIGYDTDPEIQCQSTLPSAATPTAAPERAHRKSNSVLPESFGPLLPPSPCGNNKRKLSRRKRHKQKLLEKINLHEMVIQQVQETFNLTWTLTWIKLPSSRSTSSSSSNYHPTGVHHPLSELPKNNYSFKPMVCKVWIERGTLVRNNTVMIEPSLKWRPAFPVSSTVLSSVTPGVSSSVVNGRVGSPVGVPPLTASSMTFTKPRSIPLLKICRILPAEECQQSWTMDPKTYGTVLAALRMVPMNRSIVIRCSNGGTCASDDVTPPSNHDPDIDGLDGSPSQSCSEDGSNDDDDEVYIFEAPSTSIRDDLMRRWKTSVARFAALAVLEDADAILTEFFNTSSAIPLSQQTTP